MQVFTCVGAKKKKQSGRLSSINNIKSNRQPLGVHSRPSIHIAVARNL